MNSSKAPGRLRLYYSPGACSMAAHIVLEETGAAFELRLVSSAGADKGEMTSQPAWTAINPKARIPALWAVDGYSGGAEKVLTELNAILYFLALSYPEARLWPHNVAAQARCIEWMNWLSGTLHGQSYGQIWRPHRFSDTRDHHSSIMRSGTRAVAAHNAYIERLLADGRAWAVGDHYTVVDPYLLVFYLWALRIGLDVRRVCPAWTAHTQRIRGRRAVRNALLTEGILF